MSKLGCDLPDGEQQIVFGSKMRLFLGKQKLTGSLRVDRIDCASFRRGCESVTNSDSLGCSDGRIGWIWLISTEYTVGGWYGVRETAGRSELKFESPGWIFFRGLTLSSSVSCPPSPPSALPPPEQQHELPAPPRAPSLSSPPRPRSLPPLRPEPRSLYVPSRDAYCAHERSAEPD